LEYNLLLRFLHNAAGLTTTIPINLTVDRNSRLDETELAPLEFNLEQNFPNPFNSRTVIPFTLPEASHATLTIYDLTGREVLKLVEGELSAGRHYAEFDASDFGTGVYFVRLEAGSRTAVGKLVCLK